MNCILYYSIRVNTQRKALQQRTTTYENIAPHPYTSCTHYCNYTRSAADNGYTSHAVLHGYSTTRIRHMMYVHKVRIKLRASHTAQYHQQQQHFAFPAIYKYVYKFYYILQRSAPSWEFVRCFLLFILKCVRLAVEHLVHEQFSTQRIHLSSCHNVPKEDRYRAYIYKVRTGKQTHTDKHASTSAGAVTQLNDLSSVGERRQRRHTTDIVAHGQCVCAALHAILNGKTCIIYYGSAVSVCVFS